MHPCDISKGYLVTKIKFKGIPLCCCLKPGLTTLFKICVLYIVTFQETEFDLKLTKANIVIEVCYIKTKTLCLLREINGYILQDS